MATKFKEHHNKLRKRSAACPDGKIDYFSRKEALHFAKLVQEPVELFPYKCPHCGAWHLTKVAPREVSSYTQLLYREFVLTFEQDLWTCPQLPDRFFASLKTLKMALNDLIDPKF